MNIQFKYVLLFLILYLIIKIFFLKETFQSITTLSTSLNSYTSDDIMSIDNNNLTYLENDIFNFNKKVSASKDKCNLPENISRPSSETNEDDNCELINSSNISNNVDKINAKRLCIIEGNDIECISADDLGNALSLPEYRKNSVCIDGACLNKGNIDILKSMTPSGRSDTNLKEIFGRNNLMLKSADNTSKCFSQGQTRAHSCATHNSKLTVTRADGGRPNSNWGWGQNLKVGGWTKRPGGQSDYLTGVACGSRYAADNYRWGGTNNSSSCLPFTKYVGSKNREYVVDLPPGKYYAFRPGYHRGTDQLSQYCCWGDQFRMSLSPGQRVGGEDMYYETMKQAKCENDKSKLTLESSKNARDILFNNGLLPVPGSGSGSGSDFAGQTREYSPPPLSHH